LKKMSSRHSLSPRRHSKRHHSRSHSKSRSRSRSSKRHSSRSRSRSRSRSQPRSRPRSRDRDRRSPPTHRRRPSTSPDRTHHHDHRHPHFHDRRKSRSRERSNSPRIRPRPGDRDSGRGGSTRSRSNSEERDRRRDKDKVPFGERSKRKEQLKKEEGIDPSIPSTSVVAPATVTLRDDMSEDEMMKVMGLPFNFDTSKGKQIDDNTTTGFCRIKSKRHFRQYMNRKGGFNRPLAPSF